jgi:hydroxyacylglutathione hydrolase
VPTPLTPEAFAREAEDAVVLDTRMELAFNAGHVPGALSIWRQGLGSFAGWFLPYDRPILLVTEEEDPMPVVRALLRMGFDNVAGHLAGGMHAWHTAGLDSAAIGMMTVPDLCRRLDEGNRPVILDVRSDEELEREGAIADARHIHITEVPRRLDEVPGRRPIHIFCGSGLRSTVVASLLERGGRRDLTVVLGGIRGWNSVSCPLELVERA